MKPLNVKNSGIPMTETGLRNPNGAKPDPSAKCANATVAAATKRNPVSAGMSGAFPMARILKRPGQRCNRTELRPHSRRFPQTAQVQSRARNAPEGSREMDHGGEPFFVRRETGGELEVKTRLEAVDGRGRETIRAVRICVLRPQMIHHLVDGRHARLFANLHDCRHVGPDLQAPTCKREANEPVVVLETAQGRAALAHPRGGLP